MTRLTWLAEALRAAGLNVVEVGGWQQRGSDEWAPTGVTVHHTASPAGTTAAADAAVIVHGHSTLPGPIAQLMVARDGTVWVCAAGRANHAGTSSVPWSPGDGGNRTTVGIEACNNGVGELWPAAQIEAIVEATAAVCNRLSVGADRVVAHREIARPQGRKIDPAGAWAGGGSWDDMDAFRRRVAERIVQMGVAEQEVRPVYQPPLTLAPIVDQRVPPNGAGVWLLGQDGGVYAFGGAPFHGSPAGKPYWSGRSAARFAPHPGGPNGYTVVASTGETYSYP